MPFLHKYLWLSSTALFMKISPQFFFVRVRWEGIRESTEADDEGKTNGWSKHPFFHLSEKLLVSFY